MPPARAGDACDVEDAGASGSLVNDGNAKSNRYSGPSALSLTFAAICAGAVRLSTLASRYVPPRVSMRGNTPISLVT